MVPKVSPTYAASRAIAGNTNVEEVMGTITPEAYDEWYAKTYNVSDLGESANSGYSNPSVASDAANIALAAEYDETAAAKELTFWATSFEAKRR